GLSTRQRSASGLTTRRPRPIARAAAQAASRPGTEVAATEVRGSAVGRHGRWAQLVRRRPQQPVTAEPEQASPLPAEESSGLIQPAR
ncbi:MAG TPA: hypothetical protein VK816_06750, partial [Jatrophihabitantaceae bacterium]|nr:hypothetical protein [Jatrophihabitantaceae bacterium]